MARTITVTSGKGGVGKTNLSLNLAVQLASGGHRTCLFDADLGLANVNVLLNQFPDKNLADVISGDKRLADIIIRDSSGLDIIPGSSGVEKMADLDPDQIGRLIYDFSQINDYEFYIFDTSPGISRNVIPFCLAASELVMVITPEPTSLVDGYALLKVLTLNGFKGQVKIILNQCPDKNAAKAAYNRFKGAAIKRLPVEISPVGLIIQDRHVVEAVKQQTPVVRLFPKAPASKSIRAMAKRILEGGSEDIEDREIVLFWTRFFDSVRGPYNLGETTATGKYLAASSKTPEVTKPAEIDEEPPTEVFKLSDIGLAPPVDSIPADLTNHDNDGAALPSLPQTLTKLLQVLNFKRPENDDVYEAISLDPALAFRVLKIAAPDRITGKYSLNGGLESAVKSLGASAINNLVLTESINRVYSSSHGVYQWDLSGFWRHSLRCAYLAGFLGESFRGVDTNQAFLAGLLHDIGILVSADGKAQDFASIIERWDDQDEEAFEASGVASIDHAGAGADLLGRSQIQPLIADAVRYHHESPDRITEAFPLVKVVYCAEIMSRKQGRTSQFLQKISEISGLPVHALETLIQLAETKVNQTVAAIVADGGDAPGSMSQNGSALTHQVKTLSLLQGCTRQFLEARDRDAVIKTIHHSMEILFDLREIVCLLFDPADNMLKGQFVEGKTPPVVQDISIPLERRNSLGIRALESGEIKATYLMDEDDELCLIDRQMQSLLGVENLVFLPIPSESGHVGVVAAGGEREHLDPLFGQSSQILLNMASLALSVRPGSESLLYKDNADNQAEQPLGIF
jgi:MinD-like ATPase involved in chromosome partitioning or flagellar assembly/HD-like signal output (HDOD) protein